MLVHTWLDAEAELYGLNEREARKRLNETLGKRYTHGNLWRWKNGTAPVSDVRLYMLSRCLRWYLETTVKELNLQLDADVELIIHALL